MYTPKPLAWDDALNTGENSIDNQHKYLVDTLNKLGTAINENHGAEELSRILGILRFYSGWHFGKEEDCMEAYHCPPRERIKKPMRSSSQSLTRIRLNSTKLEALWNWRSRSMKKFQIGSSITS